MQDFKIQLLFTIFQETTLQFIEGIVTWCISKYATKVHAECVTDLDKQSEMIIFESILTTFESSIIL